MAFPLRLTSHRSRVLAVPIEVDDPLPEERDRTTPALGRQTCWSAQLLVDKHNFCLTIRVDPLARSSHGRWRAALRS